MGGCAYKTPTFLLRHVVKVIQQDLAEKKIRLLHETSWRYTEFIPPADRAKQESARHLLWESVSHFDDYIAEGGLEEER